MKNLLLFTSMLLLIFGCAKPNPEAEKANAEAAVKGFYKAGEKFDYETMRTFCTEDFHAIEDGHVYNNLDEFLKIVKSLEGSKGQINMDFVQTDVVKDVAFLIIKFDAVWTREPSQIFLKTIENYILKKINGKWLIHFWQSTYLPDEHDKKFTSIRLLKIPENLPISTFNDEIQNANAVFAKIGYPDCGFICLKVDPGMDSKFNWVLLGNWKNQDVYKIIHNNDEFKKWYEQSKEMQELYLKDHIYVRASLP
jgi:hypothetical protein